MGVYTTKVFDRWARKAGLRASDLCKAVEEMGRGLYEADLGGHVLKKRIARAGQGKSGGFRTLVATNKGSKWFFIFGWAKNEYGNIGKEDEVYMKRVAAYLLSLTPDGLKQAEQNGAIKEVHCHE